VLSALVQLPKGCRSPALKDGLLLLLRSSAPPDESRDGEAEPDEDAAAPAPESAGSAAAVAPARPREPDAGVATVEDGQRHLLSGNHAAAQPIFERVLQTDALNPAATVGLAACQLHQGDVDEAVKTLERARASTRPDVHLWLAYAHLRDRNRLRARESLRKAMELGWAPGNRPAEAVPEAALRNEIESLLQQRNRKRAPSRESLGSGSAIP
jgi:Tfp pilus assembly protein PilF